MNIYEQEAEWRKCAADETYFLETYWFIRIPGKGKTLLKLRDAQKSTLQTWTDERYTIALKARQIGFSTLAAAHSVWLCYFQNDKLVIMLSKTEREAMKLMQKSAYGLKHLPEWMQLRGPQIVQSNLTKLSWNNDSTIESLPSASDPARGEAVDLVIVDEWAFLPNPEEAWASIEPITDIGGRVIGISTANGYGNFFHTFYVRAKTGVSTFKSIFFPWQAGDRDADWYAVKKANMQEWQLHQEYPSDDIECFVKSGNPVFDVDALAELRTELPNRGRLTAIPSSGERGWNFADEPNGALHLWEFPNPMSSYVIGADVAEGLEHGDFSAAHVIRIDTGEVVAKWRGHVAPDLFGTQILWPLGFFYNNALMGVEVNNHGLTTLIHLRDKGYPNVYYRFSYDQRTDKQTKKIGWRTQVNTKPLMVDDLVKAMRGELALWDEETIAELRTFVRDPDGKMHGSPFDDQVISLAIANQMRKHSFSPEYVKEASDYMTFGWVLRELDANTESAIGNIGEHSIRRG